MKKLKDSPFYETPLHILNYDFGEFYLYENFIVGEIHEEVLFSWSDHGIFLIKELKSIYSHNWNSIKYISNRVHKYSVVPSDWMKFAKLNKNFIGYGIVTYSKREYFNGLLEKAFVPTKMQNFTSLKEAIDWANINESSSIEKKQLIS